MRFMTVLLLFALLFGDPVSAYADPARIMPLGDSITESAGGHASYRYWLWHDLLASAYDVDFAGSMIGVHGGEPLYPDFDQDHEGHWGWRADQILAQISAWAAAYEPELVLIHLGHNDLWQGQSISSTVNELASIIAELREVNATIEILLAQVIPAVGGIGLDSIPAFNAQIPPLAAEMHTPESPVLVVDQHAGFDPYVDTWDGVHPDESGELKMSARWFEALSALLPDPAALADGGAVGALELLLASPRPNPFWGAGTTISWGLGRPAPIRVTLYDAAGRCIATVAQERASVGRRLLCAVGFGRIGPDIQAGLHSVAAARPGRDGVPATVMTTPPG